MSRYLFCLGYIFGAHPAGRLMIFKNTIGFPQCFLNYAKVGDLWLKGFNGYSRRYWNYANVIPPAFPGDDKGHLSKEAADMRMFDIILL